MFFEILSRIVEIETFAQGTSIRELPRLRKRDGRGRWRKRKGVADVRLPNVRIRKAELHWYEASGIGKREFRIKRFVDMRCGAKRKDLRYVFGTPASRRRLR